MDKPTTENSVINIDTDPALDNNVDDNPVPDDMPKIVPPKKEKEDFDKHVAISKLLDIPLTCPYCKKDNLENNVSLCI